MTKVYTVQFHSFGSRPVLEERGKPFNYFESINLLEERAGKLKNQKWAPPFRIQPAYAYNKCINHPQIDISKTCDLVVILSLVFLISICVYPKKKKKFCACGQSNGGTYPYWAIFKVAPFIIIIVYWDFGEKMDW